ncbi:pyridoxal phosphate-dependent decarboxylase family protein [Actinophytocola sediminis]
MIESGTSTDGHALAGGAAGAQRVRQLVGVALDAVAEASAARTGPIPAGGPPAVASALADALGSAGVLPEHGVGSVTALGELTRLLTAGSVDPAHPWCAAHLHGPTLAVAAAADLVASMLNPSMDSWDQAPVASELERELTSAIARLCYPDEVVPDAVITSGGTESNLLGLLLAREAGARHVVRGHTAHHSVDRAAWLLGLPTPTVIDLEAPDLSPLPARAVLVATAGTTDTGTVDRLPALATLAERAGAWLHVDASYGGALLFSDRLAPVLDGLTRADSVAVDLHKFGWQPIAAGLLTTREPITALNVRADYLNPDDDMEAGLPDLLGRSLHTSRRPDAFKIAVTLRALGRVGVGELVERCCRRATELADAIDHHPALRLWGRPMLSTVLFRPANATDDQAGDVAVAEVRRRLLDDGQAVLGRATVDGRVWLKLTLLNPETDEDSHAELLELVVAAAVSP